jgi:hypothetical protein
MLNKKALIQSAIEKKRIPQFLFKYKSQEFLNDLLIKNELWFSAPLSFNDPFDCQINLNTENTVEEIENFFLEFPVSNEDRSSIAEAFVENPEKWHEFINMSARKVINSNGICCFSKKEDNLLLWSHYGDSHKGVCLKFDILEDPELFYFPMNVKYDENYPTYNHLKNSEQILDSLILTKANAWSYEEEFRVIKMNAFGGQKVAKKSLIEIIFGCRCDQDFINKIISLTKAFEYNLTYKRAVINKSNFSLDFEVL